MSRGVGAIQALQSLLPDWTTPALYALTQLGDVWLYFLVLPPLYWFGAAAGLFEDRDDAALLVAVALGAFALVVALKHAFALPRPPAAVQAVAQDGYGFPSGHALAATAVYGGVAALVDRWRRRTRFAAAAVVIGVVALTRVALGVHYLVDVVAGVAVGAVFLAVALRVGRRRAAAAIWLAAALGAAAVLVGGPTRDAVSVLGASVGAAAAWTWMERRDARHDVPRALALAALVVLGGVKAASYLLEPALVVVLAVNAAVLAAVVGLPGVRRA